MRVHHENDKSVNTIDNGGILQCKVHTEAVGAQPQFLFGFGSVGTGNGQFNLARSIAIDPADDVYVTEFHSPNRIQKFTSAGGFISQWSPPSGTAEGVAVGPSGNVYVANTTSNRILKYTNTGTLITQ